MLAKKINTLLVSIFIVLNILYTTFRASPTDLLGVFMFGLLICIIFLSFLSPNITQKKDIIFLSILSLFFIFHLMFNTTSLLTIGLVMASVLFFIRLKYIQLYPAFIGKIIILLFFVIVIFNTPELLTSLSTNTTDSMFSGIFDNPNSMAGFTTITVTASLFFIKDKKLLKICFIFIIASLLACKSRNAILFMISFIGLYVVLKSSFSKFTFHIFVIFIIFALYYLIVIEPQSITTDAQMFGKESGSAGRSTQILLTIGHFPLTFFGVGYDVPNEYSISLTGYAIHNFYINTIYAMGICYMAIYLYYIINIYKQLTQNIHKALLLSSHIYFLFEPGTGFSILMLNSLPLILFSLKLNQEQYENRTLHI